MAAPRTCRSTLCASLRSLKEKDWKKKEQPAAKPGPGARNAQVGQQQAAKAGGAGAVAKGCV